jgi:hypothetical protein
LIVSGTFLLSLGVYLLVAFPQFADTKFYGLSLNATTSDLVKNLGMGDGGSYTRLAVDLQDGSLQPENAWILNLWPPGVPIVLWIILKLTGGGLPIVPMIVLVGCLWSLALSLLALIVLRRRAVVSFVVFAAAWLAGPLLNGWTIHAGVISSDSISAALTVILAVALYFATQDEFRNFSRRIRLGYYLGVGLLLGVLSLFRVTWLYATLASLAALGVFVVVVALIRWRRRQRNSSPVRESLKSMLVKWSVVVVGFGVIALPWTIALGTYVHPGNFSWSTGEYQWAQTWMTDEHLAKGNAYFLIEGDVNWACDLDPTECAELMKVEMARDAPYDGTGANTFAEFQHRAIMAAVEHPLEFAAQRTDVTVKAWLSVPGEPVGSMHAVGFGIVTLAFFLVSCGLLIRRFIQGRGEAFFLLMLAGANIAIVWLSHFETRYMMPVQVIGLVVFVLALSTRERELTLRILNYRRVPRP